MDHTHALICWIGHTDLWAMTKDRSDLKAEIHQVTGLDEPRRDPGLGPIKTLTSQRVFDQVDLISNYPKSVNDAFARWMGGRSTIHQCELADPTDYEEVFQVTIGVLAETAEGHKKAGRRLAFHLSPGTPTMAAVLVLLGKTRYPGVLYQTHGRQVLEARIPFDVELFVSEVLKEPDNLIFNLSFERPSEVQGFEDIVGQSTSLKIAVERAKRSAIRHYNVLLIGESGTGKELFAHAIHSASLRKGPFKPFNCAAVSDNLFEAELFGVKKKVATDVAERSGLFASADTGTLFLDEVGECSLENQSKLLRALQPLGRNASPCERLIRPVGSEVDEQVDVRIIAATNRELLERVKDHQFREDLYYRLATIVIRIPPLRDRKTDIRLIADDTLARINRELRMSEPAYSLRRLSEPAYRKLVDYQWPGNVRQLNNVLTQAAVMSGTELIGLRDIEAAIAETPILGESFPLSFERTEGFSLDRRLIEVERKFIVDALADAGWPSAHGAKAKATLLLGLKSQQDLGKRIIRLGVDGGK
jgi:DNA-binding NtrC family response regulator